MLVLFETSSGYAIFKILKEKKLQESENLHKYFETSESARKILQLKNFTPFKNLQESIRSTSKTIDGKISKRLKKSLATVDEPLCVGDARLASLLKSSCGIDCVSGSHVVELMRCIREHVDEFLPKEVPLSLTHGLCRYKLKFSPDKVDLMIVHAVGLLDDLDKELNNFVMRLKEWYGWHFPELANIVSDPRIYSELVRQHGKRDDILTCDLSTLLTTEDEERVKSAIHTSIGLDCSEDDLDSIKQLCNHVITLSDYRNHLTQYLSNRMMALAPNVSILVGEHVGARLIAHAGSLIKLAKQPASTVQIFGAEKTLFQALKSNKNTPKYGLIYTSQLVSRTCQKLKGKASRMLAAKVSLASRVDALGEEESSLGVEHKALLEGRLKQLEECENVRTSGSVGRTNKHVPQREFITYRSEGDSTMGKRKGMGDDFNAKRPKQ